MNNRIARRGSILAILALLILSACSPAAAPPGGSPEVPATLPAAPTDQLSVPPPGDNPAVIWQRSGGFAGICHDLTINEDGSYALRGCDPDAAAQTGTLTSIQMEQLNDLLDRYVTFEWEAKPPPNSADMFQESLTFYGRGSQAPNSEEQQAISQFLGSLAEDLSRGSEQF